MGQFQDFSSISQKWPLMGRLETPSKQCKKKMEKRLGANQEQPKNKKTRFNLKMKKLKNQQENTPRNVYMEY